MRAGYLLVLVFGGPRTWMPLVQHTTPGGPLGSVAVAMFAGVSTRAMFGLI
jgi:hypothetical protein